MASRKKCARPNGSATLPATGFLRLPAIIAPHGLIPVSKSTWWAGIKAGRYPAPIKLGPNISAWRVKDIQALIDKAGT
jgi:predicted DNA-binding transcriptional regulator AlpA